MNGEQKDIELTGLFNRQMETTFQFEEALDKLRSMADDFSEGSQQRWVVLMREANALRDELWSLQQRVEAIK